MTDLSARISRAAPASTDVAAFFSSARVQQPAVNPDRLSRGLSALGHIAGLAPSDAQLQKVKESRPDVSVPLAQRIQPDLPQRPLWSTTTPVHHSKADMGDTGASASLLARLGPIPRATPPRPLLASIPASSLPERPPRARECDEEWAGYNERRQDRSPSDNLPRSPRKAAQAATSTSLSHLLSSRSPRPTTPPPRQALPAQDFRPPSPDYPPPDDEGVMLPSIAPSNHSHSPSARSPVSDGQSRESAGASDPADPATTVAFYNPVQAQPLKRKASNDLIPYKPASPSKRLAVATSPHHKTAEDGDAGSRSHASHHTRATGDVNDSLAGNPTPSSPGHESLDTSPIHAQHVFLPPADMAEQPGEPLSSLALDAPTSPTTLPLILRLSTPELMHEMPSVILDAEPDVDMFHNPISTSFPSPSDQDDTLHNQLPSPPISSSDNSEGGIHENPTTAGTILVSRAKLPDNLWSDDVASRTAARLRVREELVSSCRSHNRTVKRVSWSDEGMSYSWALVAEPEASETATSSTGSIEQAGATDASPGDREAALFLEAQAFLDNMRMKGTPSKPSARAVAVSASDKSEEESPKTLSDSRARSPASPANSSPRLSPPNAVVGDENGRTFVIEIPLPDAFQTSHDRAGRKYMAWQTSQIEAALLRDDRGARTCWAQPRKIRDGVFRLLWIPPTTILDPVSPIPGSKLVRVEPSLQKDAGVSDSYITVPLAQSSRESSNPAELMGTAQSSTPAPSQDRARIDSPARSKSSDKQNTSTPAISIEQDTDATKSYTVPLPAKWANIPTVDLRADAEFAPWLAAQRALLRTQLGAQHGSAPVSIRSLRAQGQIIYRWTVNQSEAHREVDPIPPTPLATKDAAEPKGDMDGIDAPASPRISSTSGQSSVILDITHPQCAERPASNEGNKQPIDITSTNNHQVPAESTTTARELPATQSQSRSPPQPQSPSLALSESSTIPATTSMTSGSTCTSSGATSGTPASDASQARRMQDLRQSMDAKLRDLENWLKIQDSHPHRKPLLDKLIDKAQNEVLQLQQEIDFESARASD